MDDLAKIKDKAAKAWAKSSWSVAAEAYDELYKLEPKNLMHRLRVGDCLVKQGKSAEAIKVYGEVAERYAADGMLIKAISVNKLILSLDPQQKDTQKRLAALYSKRGVATVASGARLAAAKGPDMDLPADDGPMVVESQGATREIGPGAVARAVPIVPPAPAPSAAPAPAPGPGKVSRAALLDRPSEIIELGPAEMVRASAPVSLDAAIEQAKSELKQAGSDVDVDELFEDVGEIPQVPPTPLFSDLQPAEFERLIELLAPIRVPAGTEICKEGEPADSMFVIAQGSVQVSFTSPSGKKVPLAKLVEGDFFGEFALFEGGVRKATVDAAEETELLELSKANFDRVVAEFPAVAGVLRMFYYARLADTFLAKSPIFGSLSRESRWEFVRRMTLQKYLAGQAILREGETGDALYMIRAGKVRISTGSGNEAVVLADLPPGEIFGEIAVINLQPRTATVTAMEEVEVYRLDRETARRLLSGSAEIAGKVKAIAETRVRNTIDAMITGSAR